MGKKKVDAAIIAKSGELFRGSLNNGEASTKMLLQAMGLKHRPSCLKNYLQPALQQNLIEMTQPDSPRSPTQKYHPTALGRHV
ncbi:Fic family protein [Pseudomonas sp. C27(2019)]|uniref:Fic family protein n=1 Tax=Pseudomonas sp. C27(2019) TaxID=2604941 RepID=UPI0035327291